MKIITDIITRDDLKKMAEATFGDMVKAAVDIEREILAVDAELHSDLEAALLAEGAKQKNLWGINIYPGLDGDNFVEFDSIINVRPSQGNRTRNVEDAEMRKRILEVVAKRVA